MTSRVRPRAERPGRATPVLATLLLAGLATTPCWLPATQAQAPAPEEAPPTSPEPAQTAAEDSEAEPAILVDAADARIDRRTDELIFTDIIITQDTLSVRASRAVGTGLSFESSDWSFSGDVQLTSDGALIEASEAVLTFRDNKLQTAALTGAPVTFRRESKQVAGRFARGRAQRVDYDLANASVRLSGDAWLCEDGNEITSEVIVYDIDAEQVLADGGRGEDGRVKILITPGSDAQDAPDCSAEDAGAP
ncbi:MAG: lipopolysaccharide transport periplasmic protein LptA [Pseudomonadota bacterium]